MDNIFTTQPRWGDASVGDLWTGEKKYIIAETFNPSKLSKTSYEIAGAVVGREGKKGVYTAYRNDVGAFAWASRYEWELTGYTLDGTDRTGVLSIRENSSSSANTDFTVSYNASDTAGLVATLNTFFAETSAFSAHNWYAFIADDASVHLQCDYKFWQQASYNTGKSGFSLAAAFLPEVPASSTLLAKKGKMNYPISNMARGIAYFSQDTSSTTYNPSSDVTIGQVWYPICKPGYLGTSKYQSDHCAALRALYGEGEEGWLRFMKAIYVLDGVDAYCMGERDGLARTNLLASKTYTLADGSSNILCPAAYHAKNDPTTSVFGDWHLGAIHANHQMIAPVEYGTSADRSADRLNKTLWAMGGDAVSNGTNLWSCSRRYAGYAWSFYGGGGFWCNGDFCNGYRVRPLSLNYLP